MCFESIHHCFRCAVAKSQVFDMSSITRICPSGMNWWRKPVIVRKRVDLRPHGQTANSCMEKLEAFHQACYCFLLVLSKSVRYFWKVEKQASPSQTRPLQHTAAIHTSRQEAKRGGLPVSPGLWRSEAGSCNALLPVLRSVRENTDCSPGSGHGVWEATPLKHTLMVGKLRDI